MTHFVLTLGFALVVTSCGGREAQRDPPRQPIAVVVPETVDAGSKLWPGQVKQYKHVRFEPR